MTLCSGFDTRTYLFELTSFTASTFEDAPI